MLVGDTTRGHFFSFYQRKTIEEADMIANEFISDLYLSLHWKLYVVEPNCLKKEIDANLSDNCLWYFSGDYANDNAILIADLTKNKGFLILTNGID